MEDLFEGQIEDYSSIVEESVFIRDLDMDEILFPDKLKLTRIYFPPFFGSNF